ncbi:MAG: hypothetical protein JWP63_967 [Candidatus Solibacter sp.]|nr:hypothetical protein [Candidatus Solibacter sp.]
MNHLTEEQLILHYYGETGEAGEAVDSLATEQHLETCSECRGVYGSLQRVLNVVDSLPMPERGPEYGTQVWKRIEHRLPARRRGWFTLPSAWRWVAASAACAALMAAAFFAGRTYPGAPARGQIAAVDKQAGERVLLVAVGDYLERSQMVLIELANANPTAHLDITNEQERAGDLVTETRLYRQTAEHTGDTQIASVLDELERVLVDITHAPSNINPQQLQDLRQRLEADGILFKIRVLGSNVRNQEVPAAKTAGQTL